MYVLVSRSQYNSLVTHCPEYMRDKWNKLNRNWHLGGVTARGTELQLSELKEMMRLADLRAEINMV